MARKKAPISFDFSSGGPDWAEKIYQDRQRQKAARAEAQSYEAENILKLMAEDGIEITDEVAAKVLREVEAGRSGYTQRVGPDFSNVTGGSRTVAQPKPGLADYFSNAWDDFSTNIGALADNAIADAQEAGAAQIRTAAGSGVPLLQLAARDLASKGDLLRGDLEGYFNNLSKPLNRQGSLEAVAASSQKLEDLAEVNREPAKALRARLENGSYGEAKWGTAIVDASGSMTSGAVSLFGGPAGLVAVADVYAREYQAALENGVPEAEAEQYAWAKAAPEGIAVIPAGKVLERIPGVGRVLDAAKKKVAENLAKKAANPVLGTAATITKTAIGEGLEETVTGGMQDIVDVAAAGMAAGEELRKYAGGNAPKTLEEFVENRGKDFRAGAVMGGALTAPTAGRNAVREYNTQVDSNAQADDIVKTALTRRQRVAAEQAEAQRVEAERVAAEAAASVPVQDEMFATPEDLPSAEDYAAQRQREAEEDAAWTVNNRRARTEEARASNLQDRKDNLDRRVDTARQKVEELQERMEDGDYSSGTRNELTARLADLREAETLRGNLDAETAAPATEPTSARTVAPASEPVQTELPGMDTVKPVDPDVARIAKSRERVAKANAPKVQTPAQKRAAETARRKLEDEVVAANPTLDDAQIAQMVRERMAAPAATTPAPAAPVTPPSDAGTVETPAPEAAPEPTNEGSSEDARIRDELRKAGIDVPDANPALNSEGATRTTADTLPNKIVTAVRALAERNDGKSVDIINLLRQGKVEFASTPESIGRPPSDTTQGEFNPETGQMFIYLDRVDPKDVGAVAMTTLHESTHAGQFNDRKDRPSIYRDIMSREQNSNASKLIRSAAKSGNTVAKNAVRRAENAAKRASGWTPAQLEALELVPYFVTEAVAARENGQTLGQLRGLANDIRSGARNWMRKAGINLPVDLQDIESAVQRIGGEIVATDTTARTIGAPLEMIGGVTGAGYADAVGRNRTYRGAVDNRPRYEFSDAGAMMTTDPAVLEEFRAGKEVFLGELIAHDNLFTNYPNAAEIKVKYDPNMAANGQYDGDIQLGPKPVSAFNKGSEETLMSTLLHEIQHWVQNEEGFINGSNPDWFVPASVIATREQTKMVEEGILRAVDLNYARNTLDENAKQEFEDDIQFSEASNDPRVQKLIFMRYYASRSADPGIQSRGDRYQMASAEASAAEAAYRAAEKEGYQHYLRTYGEAEARNTQMRRGFDARQLENLWNRQGTPETTFEMTQGNFRADQTIDARQYGPNSKNRTPVPPLSMSLAQDADVERVREAFSEKEQLKRALARSTKHQTADVFQAETLDTRLRRAIKRDSAREDRDAVNARIEEMMTEVQTPESWAKFKDEFPNVGKVVEEARDAIDRNSMEYVNMVTSTGRQLGNAEIANLQTILANRGRYLTRAYSAFQGRSGREWAQDRWSDYSNNIEKYLEDDAKLNEKERDNLEAILGAVKFFEKEFTIPDNDTLAKTNMDTLEAKYEDRVGPLANLTYSNVGDPTSNKRAAIITALANARDSSNEARDFARAENAVKEFMGLAERTSNVSRAFTDLAKKPGTLKKREVVPQELRTALGEITNPAGRILATLTTQAALLSRMRALGEIVREGTGTMVIPASQIDDPGMRKQFSKQITGEQYGPLNGMYATPDTFSRIRDVQDVFYSMDEAMELFKAGMPMELAKKLGQKALRGTALLTRTEKIFSVVAKPVNWAGNFVGSGLSLVRAGNLSPMAAVRGGKTALDYIGNSFYAYENVSELMDDALRYVNVESVDVAEMQRISAQKIKDYLDGRETSMGVIRDFMEKANRGRQVGARAVLSGYAMSDAWTKIANFHERVGVLTAYYEAEGVARTIEQIKDEAGDVTSYTNISNERVPKVLRMGESAGITKFVPYFSEVFRTTYTNFDQGVLDLRRARDSSTPKGRAILRSAAIRRLVGNTAASFFLPAYFPKLSTLGAAMGVGVLPTFALLAGGDDDEENAKKRRMLGEFNRYQDIAELGRDTNGDLMFFPVSQRTDPGGPFTDFLRVALMAEDTDAGIDNIIDTVKDMFILPNWGKRMVASATQNTAPEHRLDRVWPELTQTMRDMAEGLGVDQSKADKTAWIMDSFIPGIVSAYDPKYAPKFDETTHQGWNKVGMDTLRAMGGGVEVFRPANAMRGYGIENKEAQRKNRDEFNNTLFKTVNLTEANVEAAATKYAIGERKRFLESRKSVESLRAWKLEDDEINELLVNAGWSKKDAARLLDDDATAYISLRSINTVFQNKIKNSARQEDKDRLDTRLEQSKEFLEKLEDKLAKMGVEVTSE